jgi:hypothetical protein
MNIEHEQRVIVTDIAIMCKGAMNWEITSQEFADNTSTINCLVTELARLHPRWSEGQSTILGWRQGLEPLRGIEEEPLVLMFERTEELYWAWKNMRATNPTISSLMIAVPEFIKALESLSFGGRVID